MLLDLDVVTITRNDYAGLRRTLLSLPSDIASVVVIDASSDHLVPKTICSQIGKDKSYPVRYFRQSGFGIFAAMNQGLANVKSKWCIFMNSGDIFLQTNFLFSDINIANTQGLDLIVCRTLVLDSNRRPLGVSPHSLLLSVRFYKVLVYLFPSFFWPCHQSIVFNVAVHRQFIYPEVSIGGDQFVISYFMKRPILLSDCVLSCVDTVGISSALPNTFFLFYEQALAAFRSYQVRRFFSLIAKFSLFLLGFRSLDNFRAFRFKYLSPAVSSFANFIDKLFGTLEK